MVNVRLCPYGESRDQRDAEGLGHQRLHCVVVVGPENHVRLESALCAGDLQNLRATRVGFGRDPLRVAQVSDVSRFGG